MMLLATDLDGTFLGGKNIEKLKLYKLIREQNDIRLVFVTGRGMESVLPLLNDAIIPNPDYVICDVGATILNGRSLEKVQPLQAQIGQKWSGNLEVMNALKNVSGLEYQKVPQQRRRSYYYKKGTDIDKVKELVAPLGCEVLLSKGQYLDILPQGINKGYAIKQLVYLM